MKIVLAKSYFDDERYEDALDIYDELVKDAGKNQDMADIAAVGRAQALEGIASQDESEDGRKAKYKAASEAFAEYVATHEKSYLLLDAKLGAARCKALSGDKDGAIKKLEASDDPRAKSLIETIKRYDPNRKAASLFDAANAAASKIEAEKKAAAPAAAAVPAAPAKAEAEKKAAPVAPAAAKPADAQKKK